MKRKQERARQKAMGGTVEREKVVRDVQLPERLSCPNWPNRMAETVLSRQGADEQRHDGHTERND